MIKDILNRLGKRRFDKKKLASKVEQKIDEILSDDLYSVDYVRKGLTLIPEYNKWEEVREKITPDMTPEAYNLMLLEEYGSFESRKLTSQPKVQETTTLIYSLDDYGNVRVDKG